MIRPSSVRSLVTVCPHGSVRAGCNSSKPPRSTSPPAAATASASSNSMDAWDHLAGGPLRCAEARLCRLCERPHTEVVAAGDAPAGVVAIALALQRQAKGIGEQLAAARRVSGDHRHARDEQDLHLAVRDAVHPGCLSPLPPFHLLAGVPGDLEQMTIGIGEVPGVDAEGAHVGGCCQRAAGGFGVPEQLVDLCLRPGGDTQAELG